MYIYTLHTGFFSIHLHANTWNILKNIGNILFEFSIIELSNEIDLDILYESLAVSLILYLNSISGQYSIPQYLNLLSKFALLDLKIQEIWIIGHIWIYKY